MLHVCYYAPVHRPYGLTVLRHTCWFVCMRLPLEQPVQMRPMYGASGKAVGLSSIAWVSQSSVSSGVAQGYGLSKRVEPVKNCRKISKKDMKLNDATPDVKVRQFALAVNTLACALAEHRSYIAKRHGEAT